VGITRTRLENVLAALHKSESLRVPRHRRLNYGDNCASKERTKKWTTEKRETHVDISSGTFSVTIKSIGKVSGNVKPKKSAPNDALPIKERGQQRNVGQEVIPKKEGRE